METIDNLAARNLIIDNDPANIMYDPDKGFVVIDYDTREYRGVTTGEAYTTSGAEMAQRATVNGALVCNRRDKWPLHAQKVKMDEALRKKYGDAVADKASEMRRRRELSD